MNTQETDLETLELGEKVISATRNIFKLNSKAAEIRNYLEHSKEDKQPEDVRKAFKDINRALKFLEDKMTKQQTPRFRYAGK